MQQMIEEMLWGITENFYLTFRLFHTEYQQYEERLVVLCSAKDVPRNKIAKYWSMEEASDLLNYEHFQKLLDEYLEPLQRLVVLFARESKLGNFLEQLVQDIVAETSLLKTACHKLKMAVSKAVKKGEPSSDDLHLLFPLKILYLSQLFSKTRDELEKLLGHYQDSTILIRSLFLFGEEIVGPAYENGLPEFLEKIYPQLRILEFYARSAFNFSDSGFSTFAVKAVEKFRQISSQSQGCRIPEEWQSRLDSIWVNSRQGE